MPPDSPAGDAVRFPKVYATIKWAIIGSLTFLAVVAAAFWAFVLGGFAASGFHASDPKRGSKENIVITAECAWPLSVKDQDASSVCKMFFNLTPEQREQVLKKRREN